MEIGCPECGETITLNQNPIVREVLECNECGSQLIVTQVEPVIQIEVSEEIGEDWGE